MASAGSECSESTHATYEKTSSILLIGSCVDPITTGSARHVHPIISQKRPSEWPFDRACNQPPITLPPPLLRLRRVFSLCIGAGLLPTRATHATPRNRVVDHDSTTAFAKAIVARSCVHHMRSTTTLQCSEVQSAAFCCSGVQGRGFGARDEGDVSSCTVSHCSDCGYKRTSFHSPEECVHKT